MPVRVRLRWVLIIPLAMLLSGVFGAVAGMMVRGAERALEEVVDHLLGQTGVYIEAQLHDFTVRSFEPLILIAQEVREGVLDPSDHDALLKHLRQLVQSESTTSTLGFGDLEGHYFAYSSLDPPGMLWVVDEIFMADAEGRRAEKILDTPGFDARKRPWYQAADQRKGPAWSPVYPWQLGVPTPEGRAAQLRLERDNVGISAAIPLVGPGGEPLGVVENAHSLGWLSDFLGRILIAEHARSFIFEPGGTLIASSGAYPVSQRRAFSATHLRASESSDLLVRRAAEWIEGQGWSPATASAPVSVRLELGNAPHTLHLRAFKDPHGLVWGIAVITPLSDFDGAIYANLKDTLLLVGIGVAVALLLGLWFARRISDPVERLSAAASAMGQGRWVNTAPRSRLAEVQELAEAFSAMSARLQEAFTGLEGKVQERTLALSENRRELKTLLSNLPGMAYRCRNDDDWTMEVISEGCRSLTGYAPEDLVDNLALSYSDLILAEDRSRIWREVQEALARGDAFELIYRIHPREGGERWVWEKGREVLPEGFGESRLEGFISDITEFRRTQTALEQASMAATVASEAKSRFLAAVSHEIRTPLNAVIGFCDLLGARLHAETDLRYVRIIRENGQQLLVLINDILDLSKVEAGRLELSPTPTDPHELFAAVREMFEGMAADKGIALTLQLPDDLPDRILMDALRVRQILTNLIGNALKFTERGSVQVRLLCLWFDASRDQVDLVILVRDTGPGVAEGFRARVFEAFEQAPGASHQGTGLGLAITRRLAELMGGRVSLESVEGEGACFRVHLPRLPVLQPAPQALLPSGRRSAFSPAVILIADDDEINQLLLRAQLEGQPFQIVAAEDGRQAIEKARLVRPDLILMDVLMPTLSGLDAARVLKRDPATAAIPIIAVTGLAMPDERSRIEALCDGYLLKPVERPQLFEVLERYLRPATTGP